MTIALALNNALSGLRVNQRSIAVLSQNIANANTTGYSKQSVDQTALYVDGLGSGVAVENVVRKVDKYLQRAVQDSGATMNSASVLSDYSARVQVLLGQPGSGNSLDAYVSTFFNNLQIMAETPESTSQRSNVIQSAKSLATQTSQLALNLQKLRRQADSDIKEAVGQMNELIKKLDNVNAALGRGTALGQSSAGLLDERDLALQELSSYLDIGTFFSSDGQVNVYTPSGAPLVDGNRHVVEYTPLASDEAFLNDDPFNALTVSTLGNSGEVIGPPQELVSAGESAVVTTKLTTGKIYGLLQVRDKVVPDILAEIDMFTAKLRDEMNRIHNQGTGYPAPTMLTGTRTISGHQALEWSGTVRIAVLDSLGNPVQSTYPDEVNSLMRPLTMNLAKLDSGLGQGKPTVQTIIDEINNHYGAPQARAKVGLLNNIQLTTNNDQIPNGVPSTLNFDFDLENITGETAGFFVNNITVRNSLGADITNVTRTAPQLAIDATNTIETFVGQDYFEVQTTSTPSDLAVGDWVYLNDPGTYPALIGDIASSNYVGYFQVKAINGNEVQLNLPVGTFTNIAETVGANNVTATPQYDSINGGEKRRTTDNGTFTANLALDPGSDFYDISVDVGVMDENGEISVSTITYRIKNNQENTRNDRYNATAVTGDGQRVLPTTSQEAIRAILVDENGNEIQKFNGKYIDQQGYLKLVSANSEYTIAIDSLDSREKGDPTLTLPTGGTGRGFSHFFELNNFFSSYNPTATGDTVAGSAYHMRLEQRIADNPNLLATGKLTLSKQPTDPTMPPLYTYVRNSGDNSFAQTLAGIATSNIDFDAAGGLSKTNMSITQYVGQLLGYVASQASAATANYSNADTLYNGFKSRLDAITGVNLDEELANTIVYQNAYSASARIVKVTDELYEALLSVI